MKDFATRPSCICALLAAALLFALHANGGAQDQAQLSHQLHEALNLAQHGQPRQAFQLVNELLAAHPHYAPALKLKGMLLEGSGRGDEANASYAEALKATPNDPDLLYKVGVYQLIKGDRRQAITLLEHYLKFEPKDGDALFYLAQAYHLTGQNDAALKTIKSCLEIRKDDPLVWQKYGELLSAAGDNESALVWFQKAYKADQALDRIHYDLSVASFYTMDFDAAKTYALQAVTESAGDPNALALLAAVHVKLAEWDDAKATYEKLLAINSTDIPSQLGIGQCEVELKHYQQAIDLLRRLLQQDPSVALAHYYLARAYAALGDSAQAKYEADLHHQLMDATSFAATALGAEQDRVLWEQAKKLLAVGDEAGALKLFKDGTPALYATPGHPYFMVGALFMYTGQPEKGLNDLHTALKLEPKVRGAHTYIGIYYLQQGKLDLAEKEFKAELANDSNYVNATAELGSIRYKQQRLDEAISLFTESHTRTPGLLIELCDAYFRTGKVKEAKLTAEIIVVYAKNDQAVLDDLIALLRANHQDALANQIAGIKK